MADTSKLIKLSDSDEAIAHASDDIRGHSVKDRAGEDLGTVDDLLLDPTENKVRFLVVASGGFLGMGKDKTFLPVDAITRISDDEVHIDQTREHVAGAPGYDPELVDVPDDPDYYGSVYGYYGFVPFWTPGYAYPGYPSYPAE